MNELIEKTLRFAEEYYGKSACGHDINHIMRVFDNAKIILKNEAEKADETLVLLTALLHDVDDWKLVSEAENSSYKNTREFLATLDLDKEYIEKVVNTISKVSFAGFLTENKPDTIESKIVFDADKLDAIGATAVARTFAYGALNDRQIFNAEIIPEEITIEKHRSQEGTGINYIIEVLLGLKDKLYTQTAREMAQDRHAFMLQFLEQFLKEQDCENWYGDYCKLSEQ